MAEIFSAVLTGMRLSFDILPMWVGRTCRQRGMGAFVLALNPEAFLDRDGLMPGCAAMSKRCAHRPRGPIAG